MNINKHKVRGELDNVAGKCRADELYKFLASWIHIPEAKDFSTVEPRFNEVVGDRPNLFVKWRIHYIENLDTSNLRETTKMFVTSRS